MSVFKEENINNASFEKSLRLCFSKEKLNILRNAKVLVVGAGGIGCELLKNLTFSGFTQIDIIDLDTVDATNLNRQLLFNKSNVGQSKAYAARDTILRLCPTIKIQSYYKNIKDSCFDAAFFKKYDIILNALDNNEARTYVNRICISLDLPLVDAGSSGYNGQVTPVIKNLTKCYECDPMPRQKTFPICTIRSTPHKAEHCIAWSKYFYELLFGEVKQDNLLSDIKSDFWKDDTFENAASQKNVMEICYNTFKKIFDSDIRHHTHFIQPINNKVLRPILTENFFSEDFELKPIYDYEAETEVEKNSQIPWSLDKCVYYFVDSFCKSILQRRERRTFLIFNKDDPVCLNFITAASNLRMYNFNIPLMSHWEVKSIANAIIPAIASANAIVSALQASQAMNILWLKFASLEFSKKAFHLDLEKINQYNIKHIWIKQFSIGPFLLLPEALEPPKPSCYVCQLKKLCIFLHDLQAWTLKQFLSILIQKELRYEKPVVQFIEKHVCIYEPDIELDDSEFSKKMNLPLSSWGIVHGTRLYVADLLSIHMQLELEILEDYSIYTHLLKDEEFMSLPNSNSILPLQTLFRVECRDTSKKECPVEKRSRNYVDSSTNSYRSSPKKLCPHPVSPSNVLVDEDSAIHHA